MAIERAEPEDAGEILTVQRAAYVSEAQLYGDPFIPPLVESADQIRRAVETATVLVARDAGRIVGAIRGRLSGTTCMVGRLVVAPDVQRRGLGGTLLAALHDEIVSAQAFDLFTGHLSEGNLRLYRGHGYRETRRERMSDHLTLVHMRRQL
ncbi:Acetyltransferase (GNAT) domain-containing protein [Streptosporangium subroseum]|jgi:ribosomal protein S18 acetylase RimI-like enzyme|uniref:Acetyltransferase (GNAT) domain-containing protein n=1 Tax=Streptosporangium subroseum TaxID=106412 RepID=A0A239BRL0_9ACTN|nr:GNAT family N-acetyltransferase [Streptosporangium subroseum]SNS10051.1 Acetyltransferase (GNAT) domain-containing protein [Streptosporangium subroseum]